MILACKYSLPQNHYMWNQLNAGLHAEIHATSCRVVALAATLQLLDLANST